MPEISFSSGNYGIAAGLPVRQRTARRRLESVALPSQQSLELAADVALRVQFRTAQVRRGFVAKSGGPDSPPLAEIVRSGRGAAVRLKLYLTILWIAAGRPHTVSAAAQAWALILGLEDPAGKGARQIRSSLKWLASKQLIQVTERRGVGSMITLLSDLGTGDEYDLPGHRLSAAKEAGAPGDPQDYYVRLPDEFWTHGWIQVLSAPAIAFLLILLDARRGRDESTELWFSPQVADDRYTLSEDTRGKGAAELAVLSVIRIHSRPIKGDQLAAPRFRHAYFLDMARLGSPPLDSLEPLLASLPSPASKRIP